MNRNIVTGAALVLLAGCASPMVSEHAEPACGFPDVPQASAADWVCGAPVSGVAVAAVGSAPPSSYGYAYMKTVATAAARENLVAKMRSYMADRLARYAKSKGVDDRQVLAELEASINRYITDTSLLGSRVFRTAISPQGKLYVLVGMSETLAVRYGQGALRASMENDSTLWRVLQTDQAPKELAEAIMHWAP
ncbi:MAG: hypothetical protein P8009_03870 [Gammaproteobacteria bacterium]